MNVAVQAQTLAIPRSPAAVYRRCLPLVWWTVRSAGVADPALDRRTGAGVGGGLAKLWLGGAAIAGLVGVGVVAGTLANPPQADQPVIDGAPTEAAPRAAVSADEHAIPASAGPRASRPEPAMLPTPPKAISPAASHETVATPQPQPRGLDDDIALLDRADAALAAGRVDDALELLERHTTDVPASPLAPERAILRVRALCAKGRAADAEELAASWRARADLPRVAEALERTCARR